MQSMRRALCIATRSVRSPWRWNPTASVPLRHQSVNIGPADIDLSKKLFTPGPLKVSNRVKEAMLPDVGTRHSDFEHVIKYVRNAVLQVAQANPDKFTAIPFPGSGTTATEATIMTMFGADQNKVIVLENGKYAKRLADICRMAGINVKTVPVDLGKLESLLAREKDVSGVISVHCEASTGLINPVDEIGKIVKRRHPNSVYIVDALTSFGGVPLDMRNIDVLVGSSCKCLQGIPGVSCIIANKSLVERRRGKCPSLVLDVSAQYDSLETTGQFRFTAPTHVMLAFREALQEFEEEGGVDGRAKRYQKNASVLKKDMDELGFTRLLKDCDPSQQSYLVTAFQYPKNPRFVFDEFYHRLSDAGYVICPESMSVPGSFLVSTIGDLRPDDVSELTDSIRKVIKAMRMTPPFKQ